MSVINFLPKALVEELSAKKVDDAHKNIFLNKRLNDQLLEHFYQISSGQIRHDSESSMLDRELEADKVEIIEQLKEKYLGSMKEDQETQQKLNNALQDLQKYVVNEIHRLAKEKGDNVNYQDIETNKDKRKFDPKEDQEIATYKTTLRLLLDSETLEWSSVFHPGSKAYYAKGILYKGTPYPGIYFRDLLGLYWIAASDPAMEMVYVTNDHKKEREINLVAVKRNFVAVLAEIRRAHNEQSTINDPKDNPSCPAGAFGRITTSAVMHNVAARLKFNPFASNELKLRTIDFIVSELNKLNLMARTRIGKYLSDESIFLAGDEEDKHFVLNYFISLFLGNNPQEGQVLEHIMESFISYLREHCVELKFIFDKMNDNPYGRFSGLRKELNAVLITHLQSLLEPKTVMVPDEVLIRTILINSINASLETALKVRKKEEIEKGLEELRTQIYRVTLRISSMNQEKLHEYAKMFLFPEFYDVGFERLGKIVLEAVELEKFFKGFYQKSIAGFESMTAELMTEMMKAGEIPGISEEYEKTIRSHLDALISRVAQSVLTPTSKARMTLIDQNIQSLKTMLDQGIHTVIHGFPLLPGQYLRFNNFGKPMPGYDDNIMDWAKYIVALSLRSVQIVQPKMNRVKEDIRKIHKQMADLQTNAVDYQTQLKELATRKKELDALEESIKQDYDFYSKSDHKLIENLIDLIDFKFDAKAKAELVTIISYLFTKQEIVLKINHIVPESLDYIIKVFLNKGIKLLSIASIGESISQAIEKTLESSKVDPFKEESPFTNTAAHDPQINILTLKDPAPIFEEASLDKTEPSRYIMREAPKKENTEAESEEEKQKREAMALAEKIAEERKEFLDSLPERLDIARKFIKENKPEQLPLIEWLDLQQVGVANHLRAALKMRADQGRAVVQTQVRNIDRRYGGRGENIGSVGPVATTANVRRIYITPDDIIAFRKRIQEARERLDNEILANQAFAETFTTHVNTLKEYGYQPLNLPVTKTLEEYKRLANIAIKVMYEEAIKDLATAETGSFRIIAGLSANEFCVIGKSSSVQTILFNIFVYQDAFHLRDDQGRVVFIVPTFEHLKRQLLQFLNGTITSSSNLAVTPTTATENQNYAAQNLEHKNAIEAKEIKEHSESQKQLFIFDFDETMSIEHWHHLLSMLNIPQGYPHEFVFRTLMGEKIEGSSIVIKNPGLKNEKALAEAFKLIQDNGHHLAIATSSKYPGLVFSALRKLGLTREEISKIYFPEPYLFEKAYDLPDRKNSHIKAAMAYFGIKNLAQVTFVDNDLANRIEAHTLAYRAKIPQEVGVDSINPDDMADGIVESVDNQETGTIANSNSKHLPLYLKIIREKIYPTQKDPSELSRKTALMEVQNTILAKIDSNDLKGVMELLKQSSQLKLNEQERIQWLFNTPLYRAIENSNLEMVQFLLNHSNDIYNMFDQLGKRSWKTRRNRGTYIEFGYISRALIFSLDIIYQYMQQREFGQKFKDAFTIYNAVDKALRIKTPKGEDSIDATLKEWSKYNKVEYYNFCKIAKLIAELPLEIINIAKQHLTRGALPSSSITLTFSSSGSKLTQMAIVPPQSEPRNANEKLADAIKNNDLINMYIAIAEGAITSYDEGDYHLFLANNSVDELPLYLVIRFGSAKMIKNTFFTLQIQSEREWNKSMIEHCALWRMLERLKIAKLSNIKPIEYADLLSMYVTIDGVSSKMLGKESNIKYKEVLSTWSERNRIEIDKLLEPIQIQALESSSVVEANVNESQVDNKEGEPKLNKSGLGRS